jgi:phenylalanyl-tRNA synthetase beta chain
MKVSLKWLQDYVNISPPVHELAHRLTMAGNEVSALDSLGRDWDGICVGLVTTLEQHPNADRLQLVTVDLGDERMTVVTGAPNLAEGQKVPFARVGAQLIDGHTGELVSLKPAKIRGVRSEGMACSEISDRHEGIMILPPEAPTGMPLSEYLGDTILDFSTTPNRPDCLSVIGIAREVAALTGQVPHIPDISYEEPEGPIDDMISVEIHDPDLCPRYCASLVKDVRIGPSPPWMQQRILASGMRPINNIVDITNYVMLEYGQPLHAFDYKQIKGRKIIVRRAGENETLFTLDGVERKLDPGMLAIADQSDAIALAGVMGGADSEVIGTTTSILLEAANFNGASIRRTSIKLGLRSEASSRFEKSISPDIVPMALRRATELFVELAGGKAAKGIADVYPGKKESNPILLTKERGVRVLGLEFDTDRIVTVLTSLGFNCEHAGSPGDLLVTVPYWRTDVRLPDDLIEEVARIIGYEEIPTTMLRGEVPERAPAPLLAFKDTMRDLLVGCGMHEIITYSLVSEAALDSIDPQKRLGPALRAANPMSSEQEYLRTSLRAGLLATLSANQRHEQDAIRLFELGEVYFPRKDDLPEEREMLVGVLSGPRSDRSWHAGEDTLDFFDAKGILETVFSHLHMKASFGPADDQSLVPGRTAAITIGGQRVGVLGEVHPNTAALFDASSRPVILFELDVERLLSLAGQTVTFEAIPRFPEIARDLALVVDSGVPSANVKESVQSFPLVGQVTLFDVYAGKQVPQGKKSLAFSVRYQSLERTLTDAEVDKTEKQIVDRLTRELGATLRS